MAAAARVMPVFLQDFVDLPVGSRQVGLQLARGGAWLAPLADQAVADGRDLLVRLGRDRHPVGALVALHVQVGEALVRDDATVIPIRWEAARLAQLFPVLDGQLDIAPLDDRHSRVLLQASYRPPLDGVGRWLDGAVLHRVAESTVRSFLQLVATEVASEAPG